jgi:hypothetical protein
MVRTVVYFFLACIVLGVVALPGLAAFGLVLVPFAVGGFIWRIALTVITHDRPSQAVVHVRRSHLLGPGGPDDSFAALAEDEYPTEAPARASVNAQNGLARGGKVLRSGPTGTPSVRPRGESSIQGAGG